MKLAQSHSEGRTAGRRRNPEPLARWNGWRNAVRPLPIWESARGLCGALPLRLGQKSRQPIDLRQKLFHLRPKRGDLRLRGVWRRSLVALAGRIHSLLAILAHEVAGERSGEIA